MKKIKIIRRRALALLLTLVMCLGMLPGTALAAEAAADAAPPVTEGELSADTMGFAGGSGTESDPYLISSAGGLRYLAQVVNSEDTAKYHDKYFALTADIDLGGAEWTPIGIDVNHAFWGTFYGGGHTISNFTCDRDVAGLFGWVAYAKIYNLTISDAAVTASGPHCAAGALVAVDYCDGNWSYSTDLDNCHVVDSTVQTNGTYSNVAYRPCAGGLVGTASRKLNIRYCTVENSDISSSHIAGGVLGSASINRCTININNTACINSTVSSTGTRLEGRAGGILGSAADWVRGNNDSNSVIGCFGLVLDNCLNTASVTTVTTGTSSYSGGMIGYFSRGQGTYLRSCLNTGTVSKGNHVMLGYASPSIATTTCYTDIDTAKIKLSSNNWDLDGDTPVPKGCPGCDDCNVTIQSPSRPDDEPVTVTFRVKNGQWEASSLKERTQEYTSAVTAAGKLTGSIPATMTSAAPGKWYGLRGGAVAEFTRDEILEGTYTEPTVFIYAYPQQTHTVTFDLRDGSPLVYLAVPEGEVIPTDMFPDTESHAGSYTFSGWEYPDYQYGDQFTVRIEGYENIIFTQNPRYADWRESTTVTDDIVLYAKWDGYNVYYAQFETSGGPDIPSQRFTDPDTVIRPQIRGWTISDWCYSLYTSYYYDVIPVLHEWNFGHTNQNDHPWARLLALSTAYDTIDENNVIRLYGYDISKVDPPADTPDSIDALTITKTVDKTTAEVNDELTYTITVTNPGSEAVTGVTVTDVLPDGTDFVSAGQRGSYVSDDRTVTWSSQTVPPKTAGQDGKLELTLKIKVTKEGAVSNTATLTVPDKAPVTSDPAETTVGPKSEPQIKVTKRMGTPVVDEEAGTATVDYTVTVKNTGNKTLYGLRIDDTLTTTVKSGSAKMTIIPVSGYIGDEAESTVTPDDETERSWTLLDRNDEFAQGQEKVLKYQLILENTGDDELSVDLENTAAGGSWRAPKTAPQGVRTLALDDDAPDVTDDSTASGNLGPSSGNVTIPPKPSGDACGHPHDGDGNCTEPGCTHTEEGKDCCPKPEEPEPPETFTVTWIDRLTDEIIGTQTVTSLAEAVYPEHPAHKGYQGSGWSQPVPDGDGSYTIYAEYVELQVDPEAPSYAYLRDELGIMVRVECDADATHEPLDYEVPLKAGSYSADVRGSRCVITIAPDLYVADCDGAHSIDGISPQTIELLYEEDEVIETPDQEDPDVPAGAPSDEDPAPSDEDPAPSDEDPAPSDEDPAPSGEDMEAPGEPAAPVQFSALSLADGPAGSWRLADGEPGTVTFSVHCEKPDAPDVPDVPETLEVTVVWLDDEDGNTLKTAKVEVPADDPTSIPGRLYPRNPTRDGYRFTGWSDPVERDGVVTIVAQWEKLPDEERTLTVTWLDWDGALLAREDWDPDDPEPRYPGRTPVRPDSSRYTYTFSGWDRQVDGEGNVTYTAVYTRDRIYDDDGDDNYGGGGNGGTAPTPPATAIPDADVPQGGDTTTILDEQTPLAGAIGLNNTEHFAYMIGYENGTVRPLGQITRAEVATIFFRLMDDSFRSQYWSTASGFSDVAAGKWFNNAVSTGVNAGKLTGYPDGTFRPNQSITRAEFAAIAVRFLSDEVQGVSGGSFSDTAGHWAADAIGRASAAGWITGYPDGAFRPNQSITRAEAATIINNMLGRAPDKDHLLAGMTTWPDNPEGAWYYEAIQEATNSHDYDRDELGVTEIWRAIQTVRDWKALEEQWAA